MKIPRADERDANYFGRRRDAPTLNVRFRQVRVPREKFTPRLVHAAIQKCVQIIVTNILFSVDEGC